MQVVQIHTIIVNYNGLEWNSACIHSLLSQEGIRQQIIVVDNASTDGSLQALQEEFGDQLVYIPLPHNILFAAGCNVGIRKALADGTEYIFIINNDTIIEFNCLQVLLETLNAYPKAAAVQPLLTRMDNPQTIASAGCLISRMGGCWDKDSGRPLGVVSKTPFLVPGVTGAACLWQGEVLRDLGLFDEKFGMYFEDVDLSLRARKKGYELYTVPAAQVGHWVSATTNIRPSGFCVRFCQTNALRLIFKHWPDSWFWKDAATWAGVSLLALISNIRERNWGVAKGIFIGMLHGLAIIPSGCLKRAVKKIPENDCLKKWIEHDKLYPPAVENQCR